ncbi:hypothetical protein T484DRAFT_1794711 [Baffinella frigidus]|nr:hypothetical protein T484DRAFT_1794711 [Cryptophyta sp. CCMP2293]
MRVVLACFAAAAAIESVNAFSAPALSTMRLGNVRSVSSIGAPAVAPRARAAHTQPRMSGKEAVKEVVKERTVRAPVFDEVCEQTGITLSRYMMEVSRANPEMRDLESLMGGIQQACKTIANLVDRATITGMVPWPISLLHSHLDKTHFNKAARLGAGLGVPGTRLVT